MSVFLWLHTLSLCLSLIHAHPPAFYLLLSLTQFTQQESDSFKINDLRLGNYIESDDLYCQQTARKNLTLDASPVQKQHLEIQAEKEYRFYTYVLRMNHDTGYIGSEITTLRNQGIKLGCMPRSMLHRDFGS